MSERCQIAFSIAVISMLFGAAARADECDVVAAKIAAIDGVSAEPRNSAGIPMKHPEAPEILLACPLYPGARLTVIFSCEKAYPSKAFFDLVAKAGRIVVGGPPDAVREGALKCQREALKSQAEMAETEFRGLSFECQAYSGHGGGASITISRE